MEDSIFTPSEVSIEERLRLVQSELKAPKSLYNNFAKYSYRNLESILEGAKPLLLKYGLTMTITDDIVLVGSRYYVKATATVTDGKLSISTTAFAREEESKKGTSEGMLTGATSSYARKYAACGLLLVDGSEDLDETASKPQEEKPLSPVEQTRIIAEQNGIREDFLLSIFGVKKLEDLKLEQIKGFLNHPDLFRQKQEEADGNKGKA